MQDLKFKFEPRLGLFRRALCQDTKLSQGSKNLSRSLNEILGLVNHKYKMSPHVQELRRC